MANWLYWFFGLDNGGGSKYLFWSGSGSDISELLMIGTLFGVLRKFNCETHKCWRMGRHEWYDHTTNATHRLCRKHHPDDHLTHEHIDRVHLSRLRRKATNEHNL